MNKELHVVALQLRPRHHFRSQLLPVERLWLNTWNIPRRSDRYPRIKTMRGSWQILFGCRRAMQNEVR